MDPIPRKAQDAIVSRVKVMGKMDIAERRLPQDGRATIRIGDGEVDVRISSVPDHERRAHRDALARQDARGSTRSTRSGSRRANLAMLREYLNWSHGIILVTGPRARARRRRSTRR